MAAEMELDELTSTATIKEVLCELIVTALFLFGGVGSVAAFIAASGGDVTLIHGLPVIAITFGILIAVLAAGASSISGGHINPAVTFAMMITGQVGVSKGLLYIAAQLVGACIGVLLLRAFIDDKLILAVPGAGGLAINTDVVSGSLAALGLEIIGTAVLVWTVFAVAVTKNGSSGIVAPLYIGLAVMAMHFVLVPLTGCGINPARAFGPELVNGRWDDFWVYWVGPLIGAAIAGFGYFAVYLREDEAGS